MPLAFNVQTKKQIRVIIDTDAACEADDPFAIVHALMSPKLKVCAIFAEQFGNAETTKKSYDEINKIVSLMSLNTPVYMGANGPLSDVKNQPLSPASCFLIEEAIKDDPMPLFVLCIGAITNIASALQARPEIAPRMTIVWIAGHPYNDKKEAPFKEYNSGNDVSAANIVFNNKNVNIWQIPNNVYGSMRIGLAELQKRVYPCGEIGKHLFENMIQYNNTERANWTAGESWTLGDSPAVGVVLDDNCGHYEYVKAPNFNNDTSYIYESGKPLIRVYKSIDSRYIIEDFIAKLEFLYSNNN